MQPLVSVIISSFNSAAFIVETLESIKNQTWNEIELVVTDDCSTDNTTIICEKWIQENRERFVRSEVIASKLNTGISGNANRGLKAATGEWIKFLGADDTLINSCIENNVRYINDNPDTKVLFSKVDIYMDNFKVENHINTTPEEISQSSIIWPDRMADSQYRMLLISDRMHFSPSFFINRETLLSIGGFDERFRLLEDYPLWLNLTKNGYRLNFMDKVTVNYRRHSKAINNTGINYLIKPNYYRSENFRKIYIYPNLPLDLRMDRRIYWFVSQLFRIKGLNKSSRVNVFLLSLFTIYMNPFRYIIWIRKRLNGNLAINEFYN